MMMKISGITIILLIWLLPIIVSGQDGNPTNNQTRSRPYRFAVPVRELKEFVQYDVKSGNFSGFSIDVFYAVVNEPGLGMLPSDYTLEPYKYSDGVMRATFDDMLQDVHDNKYDGAIGDISILYDREQRWVDFTMPYLDWDIGLLVRLPDSNKLGLSTAAKIILILSMFLGFVILMATSFLIWNLCFRHNNHASSKIDGLTILTYVVMILLPMVLLLAISSYIPPQTSSSSFPTPSFVSDIKSLDDLKRIDAQVGYRQGAFGKNLLIGKVGLSDSQLVQLNSEADMVQKLRNGGKNGGVDALIAGIPYLKLLQSKHCQHFSLVPDLTLQSTGFGFAFPKDQSESEGLVDKFSEAILKLVDNGNIANIQATTIGDLNNICQVVNGGKNNGSTFQDRLSVWLPVSSAIFVVTLVILIFLSIIRLISFH